MAGLPCTTQQSHGKLSDLECSSTLQQGEMQAREDVFTTVARSASIDVFS